MKAIFNIEKNIRNSRSIGLIVLALLFGSMQVWGTDYEKLTPGTHTLSDGDEILIAIEDRKAGTFTFIQSGSTKHLVQTVTDGVVSNPAAATIWIATASSSNWIFRMKDANSNGYLSNGGSNTTLTTSSSTQTTWAVSNNALSGYKYFRIQRSAATVRYVGWSGSTFAAYATSNFAVQGASSNIAQYSGALQIFRKVAGYAITWNNGGHGTAPTSPTNATSLTLSAITGVTGYTCTGWKANVAVTNTSTSATISAGTLIANGTNVTLSQATTFTAQWETAKYTVSFGVSPAGYGTVSQASVTNVPHGTVPSSSTNTVTVNGTTVTATPHAQDADYNYAFSSWSGIPGSVTSAVTITANFTRTARQLTNYRTSCSTACDDKYSFHYGPQVGAWETPLCFTKTGEHDWSISNFTIPSHTDGEFYVGWEGSTNSQSVTKAWTDALADLGSGVMNGAMVLLPTNGSIVGQATGAKGTLIIWDNTSSKNQYVGFKPNGYGITYGGNSYAFEETATANKWETEVVTLPNVSTTYNVGLSTATSGTYVKCAHSKSTDEAISAIGVTNSVNGKKKILLTPGSFAASDAVYAIWDGTNSAWGDGTTKLMTDADGDGVWEGVVASSCVNINLVRLSSGTTSSNIDWSRKWNQTGNIAVNDLLNRYTITSLNGDDCAYTTTAIHPTTGQKGKFRIWANSNDENWYVHFVPYYTITYKSYDGSSTLYTDVVSSESTFTVRAAETGSVGWAESSGQSAASSTYTVGSSHIPTSDVTLYVACTAYTVSYTATSGTIERASVPVSSDVVLAGNTVTLPTVTGSSLTCAQFLGWYAGDYNNPSKPVFLEAGSSYEPTGDVTLKALYAIIGDNYELLTDEDDLVVGSSVIIAYREYDGDFDDYNITAMSETQKDNNRGEYSYNDITPNADGTAILGWVEAAPDVAELTLEEGVSSGTFSFYAPTVYDKNGAATSAGYLYGAGTSSSGTNYLRTRAAKTGDGYASWTITISGDGTATVQCGNTNTPYMRYNSTNSLFTCYNSSSAQSAVSIYQRSVSNYTTSPACTTYNVSLCSPSHGTISASPTTVTPGGYTTLTFTPATNYMLDAVTVTSGTATPADPVYSSGPTSAGTVRINSISSDITVCATFKAIPLYTVTFVDVDNSNATQTRTQGSYGANITTPSTSSSTAHDPCDATWSFVGWCPSSSLSGSTTEPTGFISAGGTLSGALLDDDVTYYSVYTNSNDGTTTFVPGKSGTYYFKAITETPTTVYATGAIDGSGRYPTNNATKIPFVITYNSVTSKYTIKNSLTDKYVAPTADGVGYTNNLQEQAGSFEWGLIEVTKLYAEYGVSAEAKTGEWLFSYTNKSGNTRAIYYDSYFKSVGYKDYDSYALYLEPASQIYYYNASSCTDLVTMTFHPIAGGEPTWADGHPKAEYTDVAKGTISVFPTDAQDGWTFLGWTAGQSYNDNREDAGETLDDDNASATAPSQTIYSTGGNSYNLQADIDMYPVFTKFADNDPFDQINGGDYYIYYIADGDISPSTDAYGANNRIYAGSYSSSAYSGTASCNDAALFTFTKLPNGNWTIYDNKNNGGTVGNPKHYLCGEQSGSGNDLTLQATATAANYGEWTITLVSGNQFTATCFDSYVLQAQTTNATSGTFKNYASSNYSSDAAHYHRVYLGTCTERLYSSDPTNTPKIDLNGSAGIITSSQNGAVRGAGILSVSGSKLAASITINSNSSDLYFSTSASSSFALADANQPKTEITISAVSGKVAPTTVYVHYKPSSNTDTWTTKTITASSTGAVSQTKDVNLRTVKENFVIATKVAGSWYALPADMSSASVYEPVLIEVDESNKVAYGPSTVAYKMWPVQTVNGGSDRYASNGDRVRFAGNSNKGLMTSSGNNHIQNNATITTIGSTAASPATYEWTLSTTDRETYTMYNDNGSHYLDIYRPTSGGNAGKLIWAGNDTYVTNEVHFFPLTERAIISIIPREWKSNGLVFAIDADDNISLTSGHTTAKIGTGDAASATLTRHSTGGYGLYEVALPTLTSHYGKVLTLKMKIGGVDTYAYTTIPIIVSGTTTTTTAETPFTALSTASKDYDVVILDGAKLTTNATASGASSFQNFYVYSGGTWINDNGSTSLNYLELRGGIKGIGAKDSHIQGVPHVMLNKAVSSTAGANLDMTVYTDHGYALSVPFDVDLSQVNFANSLKPGTGAQVNGTLASQFWIRKYDGAVRAANGKGGWVDITPADNKTIHAGEGYTLQGKRPKGQPFAVIRFPFTGVASWANASGEVAKADIPIYAHAGGANTPDNDKGWNLIANPYMATIAYNTDDELSWAASFKVGSLTQTEGAQWDGKYQWEDAGHAYVTIPNDSYTAFPQTRASKATFYPFKNFFIQTTSNGVVSFVRTDRHEMPRYLMAQAEENTPIYADINLSHGEESAQAGLTIDADATTGYKFGEDYTIFESREELDYLKVYTIAEGHYLVGNTLTPAETAELVPLEFFAPSTEGAYVFSIDEGSDINRLEYVILYDALLGLSTNLLTDDYAVELDKTGLIEDRFSIGIKIKEKENNTTGIDDVNGDAEQPLKFIYRDKIYILRNGVVYDATGKQVREINK